MKHSEASRTGAHPAGDPAEAARAGKRRTGGGRIALTALVCVLAAIVFFMAGWIGHFLSLGPHARALLWAVDTAERYFYDGVDEDALYGDIFEAFALDPYSEYYTKEEYEAVLASNRGEENGLGLTFTSLEANGGVRIYRVAGNSPAEEAGLRAGMYLHAFGEGEDSLKPGTATELVAFMQGRDSVALSCGFSPDGSDAQVYCVSSAAYALSECLYRDSGCAVRYLAGRGIAENPVGGIEGLPETVAYLRLDAFYADAAAEVSALLDYMRQRGRRDLILDLRLNGGGAMSVLQAISAHLMRDAKGAYPVAAIARYKDGRETAFAALGNDFGKKFDEGARLYLLADARTASASECLIGAMISYGTLPYSHIFLEAGADGARTYGKGIMQSHYTDREGNVLKLTSAKIFWPNGRTIHGTGVREEDGAIAIEAPALPGRTDEMLAAVVARVSAETA